MHDHHAASIRKFAGLDAILSTDEMKVVVVDQDYRQREKI